MTGPVVMNAPPALSATWFGTEERTFATAVGTLSNFVGSASGFLLGLLVNNTHQLKLLLYYEALFALVLFIFFIIYFPNHPPSPPSATAALKGEPLKLLDSMKATVRESAQVFRSRDGVFVLLASGITSGASGGWGAMLVIILKDYYSQPDIQWLGFFNILGTVAGGLIIGKLHDHFRHYKLLMCLFYFLATSLFVLFSLATQRTFVCTFMEIMILNIAVGFAMGAVFFRFLTRHW